MISDARISLYYPNKYDYNHATDATQRMTVAEPLAVSPSTDPEWHVRELFSIKAMQE